MNDKTPKVQAEMPDLYKQIHSGLIASTHMAGVFVYGALAIAILASAAYLQEAVVALLAAAGAAGAAWLSQNGWTLQNQKLGSVAAMISAALGVASAILTYLGV